MDIRGAAYAPGRIPSLDDQIEKYCTQSEMHPPRDPLKPEYHIIHINGSIMAWSPSHQIPRFGHKDGITNIISYIKTCLPQYLIPENLANKDILISILFTGVMLRHIGSKYPESRSLVNRVQLPTMEDILQYGIVDDIIFLDCIDPAMVHETMNITGCTQEDVINYFSAICVLRDAELGAVVAVLEPDDKKTCWRWNDNGVFEPYCQYGVNVEKNAAKLK